MAKRGVKKDCAIRVREALDVGNVTADEGIVRAIVNKVIEEYEAHGGTDGFNKAANKRMRQELKLASADRAKVLAGIRKRTEALGRYRAYKERFGAKKASKEYFLTELVGNSRMFKGVGASVGAQQNQLMSMFRGMLNSGLEKEDIALVNKMSGKDNDASLAFESKLSQEMFELSKKDGKPGITGDEQVLRIAKVFRASLEESWHVGNDSGILIGRLDGHTMPVSHDMRLIMKKGFGGWFEKVKALGIDTDRLGISKDPAKVEAYFKEMYENIISPEKQFIDNPTDGIELGSAKGDPGKGLSKSRNIAFLKPESMVEYNREFGNGSILNSVISRNDYIARVAPLVQRFGTDVRKNIDHLKSEINKDLAADGFEVNEVKLKTALDTVLPDPSVPTDDILRSVGNITRGLSRLALLGKVWMYSPIDFVNAVSSLKATTGVGYGEAVTSTVRAFRDSLPVAEQKKSMQELGWFAEDLVGELNAGKFAGDIDDHVPGVMSKATRLFFKFTGTTYLTSAARSTIIKSMSRQFSEFSGVKFNDLPLQLRENLKRYNIEDADWEIIRTGVETDVRGANYLTPEAMLRNVPRITEPAKSAKGAKRIKASIERKQARQNRNARRTVNKFRLMLLEHAAEASPQAGARERRLFFKGTKAGTEGGEFRRTALMFKPTITKMLNTTMRFYMSDPTKQANFLDSFDFDAMKKGEWSGVIDLDNLAKSGDWGLVGSHIAATTAMGGMIIAANEMAKGNDPTDVGVFEAMARGGSLGLLGDFTSGEALKYGGSLDYALGPVFTSLAGGVDAAFKTGSAKQGVNAIKRFTPGSNTPLVGQAMDMIIFDSMGRALDPKWDLKKARSKARGERAKMREDLE